MSTPAERVAKGAALLDSATLGTWRENIDASTLDVGSIDTCPLAQLFGSYTAGAVALGLVARDGAWKDSDDEFMVAHGFEGIAALSVWGRITDRADDYAALTAAWRAEVAAR